MVQEKRECPICGKSNIDVLEEHLLALAGDESDNIEWTPPVYMTLCVNCHRVIRRCCWALIGDKSQMLIAKYFVLLQSLPTSLAKKLQGELRAAIDSVTLQYRRVGIGAPAEIKEEKRCALCGNLNPDLLEEHLVVSREERNLLEADVIADLCASCHRIILKFYESKVLLHKYLAQYENYLSTAIKQDLNRLCQQ